MTFARRRLIAQADPHQRRIFLFSVRSRAAYLGSLGIKMKHAYPVDTPNGVATTSGGAISEAVGSTSCGSVCEPDRHEMKKPVVQLERTGCGIASVAAIVGLSYPEMKSIAHSLGVFAHDETLWSDVSHVRKLMRHFGVRIGSRGIPFRSWEALPDLGLLSIKWHLEKGRPYWHWVVFVRENGQSYVLDSKKSLRTNRRTDFGRMKPKWYISVTDAQQRLPADEPKAARRWKALLGGRSAALTSVT